MLDRTRILELIPHQGAMCLLDEVVACTESTITCRTRSHLDAANPLRHSARLGAVCGVEYGLQAACVHGALSAGTRQPAGFLGALRTVRLLVPRLDDAAFGALTIEAGRELQSAAGLVYGFTLRSENGHVLVSGRATIMLP